MSVTHQGVFVQLPQVSLASFTNGDAANTKKTIATAGGDGSKVVAVNGSSTEGTTARVAQLWFTRSATSYLIGSVNIPANSGSDGATAAVNLINQTLIPALPIDNDGQPYIFLMNGDTLQASVSTTVSSGKEVDVISVYGNF